MEVQKVKTHQNRVNEHSIDPTNGITVISINNMTPLKAVILKRCIEKQQEKIYRKQGAKKKIIATLTTDDITPITSGR